MTGNMTANMKRTVFSTSAIMLRRVDFGDYDLILTFLTPDRGKISAIAKSAKKSKKRFPGILELFSVLQLECSRGRGLPILQEASLDHPFMEIRSDMKKTAYASYWAELVNEWTEEGENQEQLYHLLYHVLRELDRGGISESVLSILFQMRFMSIAGFYPNLSHCGGCGFELERMRRDRVIFDIAEGGLVCGKCASGSFRRIYLSKGAIQQLLWVERADLSKAGRIRFSNSSLRESLDFLENFVPYHLGKMPRSLKVLRQIC